MAAKGSSAASSLRVMSKEEIAALKVFGPDGPDGSLVDGQGYVYIIQEGDGYGGATSYYKVGSSDNLNKRLQDLQTGNPRPIGIVEHWQVHDKTSAERAAHNAVAGYASMLGGGREWYKFVPDNDWRDFRTKINVAVAGL